MSGRYINSQPGGYIALIDRKLLDPHVKIYPVDDLYEAKLARVNYQDEYLAYGPISGPAFSCVPFKAIREGGFYTLAGQSYRHNRRFDMAVYKSLDQRIALAKTMAARFRPAHDKRPDIIIALTAAFSSMCCAAYPISIDHLRHLMAHLGDEIKEMKLPPVGSEELSLANYKMKTFRYRQLSQYLDLLKGIERSVRETSVGT